MLNITNHIVQINLVEGFEYFDNIGKIIRDFTEKKPNVSFNILENKELLINDPTDNIEQFFINQNNIRIVANNSNVIDNANYIANKSTNIAKQISVNHYNRIGIRCNFDIKDEEFKQSLKDELFSVKNIKYFSLTYNELEIDEKVSCNIRLFTGSKTTINQNHRGNNLKLEIKSDQSSYDDMMYIIDVDIFYKKNEGVDIENLSNDMDYILDKTLKNKEEFYNAIKNHINKSK